jgi:PIN domain nuclease of toxin-antitoxin system
VERREQLALAGLLLDTHALLWFLAGDPRLPVAVRVAIETTDETVFVSAATGWEIATKHRIGKMQGFEAVASDPEGTLLVHGFSPLAITMTHAQKAGALTGEHKDPFDRMIVAQALLEGLMLASNERIFDRFGVNRLW